MKALVKTDDLYSIVNALSRVVTARGVMPEYGYIAVHTSENELFFRSTDGMVYLTAHLDAEIVEDGQFAVDGKIFFEIIKKLPDIETAIICDEKQITIISGNAKIKLPVRPVQHFPDEKPVKPENKVSVPVSAFVEGMVGVEYAQAAENNGRPILASTYLDFTDSLMRAVAIDGYRMAVREMKCDYQGEGFHVIIPRTSAREMVSLCSGDDDVEIICDSQRVYMRRGNIHFSTGQLTGAYIDYQKVIPNQYKTRALLDVKEFRQAVERSLILCRNASKLVQLTFENNETVAEPVCRITSSGMDGEMSDCVPVYMEGEEQKIYFNASYLIDALKLSNAEHVEIFINNSVNAVKICEQGKNDRINVILPVRMFGQGV